MHIYSTGKQIMTSVQHNFYEKVAGQIYPNFQKIGVFQKLGVITPPPLTPVTFITDRWLRFTHTDFVGSEPTGEAECGGWKWRNGALLTHGAAVRHAHAAAAHSSAIALSSERVHEHFQRLSLLSLTFTAGKWVCSLIINV